MSAFRLLLDELELELERAHGGPRPIVWRYDASAPIAERWRAWVEGDGGRACAPAFQGEDALRALLACYREPR